MRTGLKALFHLEYVKQYYVQVWCQEQQANSTSSRTKMLTSVHKQVRKNKDTNYQSKMKVREVFVHRYHHGSEELLK